MLFAEEPGPHPDRHYTHDSRSNADIDQLTQEIRQVNREIHRAYSISIKEKRATDLTVRWHVYLQFNLVKQLCPGLCKPAAYRSRKPEQ